MRRRGKARLSRSRCVIEPGCQIAQLGTPDKLDSSLWLRLGFRAAPVTFTTTIRAAAGWTERRQGICQRKPHT